MHNYCYICLFFLALGKLELQNTVNTFFVRNPTLPSHKRFNEFREEDMEEMKEFLLTLYRAAEKQRENKSSVMDVMDLCDEAISIKSLNPDLVKKALAIFLTHNPKAQQLGIVAPPLKVHRDLQEVVMPPKITPVTADTLTGYNIISYFREDHDLNDHHYHWHLVYPYSGIPNPDDSNGKSMIRALNRQGELFLYMHSQMLARYNAELVSWNLDTAHAWSYRDIATFGYTPPHSLQKKYTVRPPFLGWHDKEPQIPNISTMDMWRNNILKAIENQTIQTVKKDQTPGELRLTDKNAMNWIGIITESLSPELQEVEPGSGEFVNRELYGMLHNNGHDKFASIAYPGTEGDGVMGHNESAVRDPCFWLWHRHIDDFRLAIIKKYEHSIDEYKPEAKIIDNRLKILPRDPNSKTPAGGITTILGPPQLDLDESTAKIDHEPYKWEIEVESTQTPPPTESNPQCFTVRLFIVPRDFIRDERSWIEMDKFTYSLTNKTDTIVRLDTESSVARKTPKPGQDVSAQCLCGWPQNMMLPAGRPDGMVYIALAMLTNDKLEEVMYEFKLYTSLSTFMFSHAPPQSNLFFV